MSKLLELEMLVKVNGPECVLEEYTEDIHEAFIGEVLVSYIPGSMQESIPYPFK